MRDCKAEKAVLDDQLLTGTCSDRNGCRKQWNLGVPLLLANCFAEGCRNRRAYAGW